MKIIKGESIAEQLNEWGIPCSFSSLSVAPQVINYQFNLLNPLKAQKVDKLSKNISIWANNNCIIKLNSNGFCVEMERTEHGFVDLNEYAETLEKAEAYSVAIGTDTNGEQITTTLDDLTHLLVAGTTGSGKSVAINNMIISLCCFNSSKKLALFLIDVKNVEFSKFRRLPQLRGDIITEPEQAKNTLEKLIEIMEIRYQKLAQIGQEKNNGHFPKIVVIIDELTDLIMQQPDTKNLIIRLLQKARAAGIHLILGTQSPRASILNGVMLANLPSRLALKCASVRESMLILGHKGAEELLGKGDAILKTPDTTEEKRVQTPYITNENIRILKYKD